MRTFAYCAQSFQQSVHQAAGVQPRTCPPTTRATFQPAWLEGQHLIYFKLHGLPDQPYWYGDDWITALDIPSIEAADLTGAVIFIANCHFAESPLLIPFLTSNACAIIGGGGENYGKQRTVYGADRLGRTVRILLSWRIAPHTALAIAKAQLALASADDPKAADALAFHIWYGAAVPRPPRDRGDTPPAAGDDHRSASPLPRGPLE